MYYLYKLNLSPTAIKRKLMQNEENIESLRNLTLRSQLRDVDIPNRFERLFILHRSQELEFEDIDFQFSEFEIPVPDDRTQLESSPELSLFFAAVEELSNQYQAIVDNYRETRNITYDRFYNEQNWPRAKRAKAALKSKFPELVEQLETSRNTRPALEGTISAVGKGERLYNT
jgi:plasmid stabilization system protein ParE